MYMKYDYFLKYLIPLIMPDSLPVIMLCSLAIKP